MGVRAADKKTISVPFCGGLMTNLLYLESSERANAADREN
jgi:hypothetical protein